MGDITSRAAGSAIAKVGTSIIEKLGGKAADFFKDRLAQVDLWSDYERRYIDRYGKVKLTLSGMREAVPLEQIYTGVRFLDGLMSEIVSRHLTEKRWREVLLLIPGLLPSANSFLKWMEAIAQQRVCSLKFQALLNWANKVTVGSVNPASSLSKRLMVLVFSLAFESNLTFIIEEFAFLNSILGYPDLLEFSEALDLAIELVFIFSPTFPIDRNNVRELTFIHESNLTVALDLAIQYSRAIDHLNIINRSINFSVLIRDLESSKSQVPDDEQPFEVLEAFSERFLQMWCKDLGLERELLNHSESEVQALVDYFYICKLMVRYKESAVRVSRDVWESIENAMVMPTLENES
ncbi:MAG: hypothetical protein HC852_02740 [Acaryochloridaceae cyanobacterium RU_4_10]|nr:hypothetical protein [Acaryochloridaceae cyanobacterium RU_4_10]